MKKDFDFSDYGLSLSSSLFADRVLLALLRIQRSKSIGDSDRRTLEEARARLAQQAAGESRGRGSAFGLDVSNAVVVQDFGLPPISLRLELRQKKPDRTGRMVNSIGRVLAAEAQEGELQELVQFFIDYGARSFRMSEQLLEFPT